VYFLTKPLPTALISALALALAMVTPAAADLGISSAGAHAPYRADLLPPIQAGRPTDVELLLPGGANPWPLAVRDDLRERVLQEWPADQRYGNVYSRVGLWVEYPLVITRQGDSVVVPVLQGLELPVRGRLVIASRRLARRVVVLLDVSHSANAHTAVWRTDGSMERLSAVAGSLRAARRLLDWLEHDRDRFGHLVGYGPTHVGVIAFGESTWPIIEPQESIDEVRRRLESYARRWPEGAGRTDAVCALRLASEWLEGTSEDILQEIVVLTDGDLPFSGRFTNCDAPQFRGEAAKATCLASLNRSACPASHRFDPAQGLSDIAQLFSFVRDVRGRPRVFPLLFRLQSPPRFFRELARYTSGRTISIGSESELDRWLLEFLNHEAPGVRAERAYRSRDREPARYERARVRRCATVIVRLE
jgi:hypothetical protein